MKLNVVNFPEKNLQDVPARLRSLAEAIERGEFNDCHSLAYVIDGGDNRIHIGLLGHGVEPGVTAYYLYGLAQRKLEALA